MKSNHADEPGTRLSPENEAKFRAWAVSQGIIDVDHPEHGIDYRAYWKEFAQEGAAVGAPRRAEAAAPAAGSSPGGRWVARTFLSRKPTGKKSRMESALLSRHRR